MVSIHPPCVQCRLLTWWALTLLLSIPSYRASCQERPSTGWIRSIDPHRVSIVNHLRSRQEEYKNVLLLRDSIVSLKKKLKILEDAIAAGKKGVFYTSYLNLGGAYINEDVAFRSHQVAKGQHLGEIRLTNMTGCAFPLVKKRYYPVLNLAMEMGLHLGTYFYGINAYNDIPNQMGVNHIYESVNLMRFKIAPELRIGLESFFLGVYAQYKVDYNVFMTTYSYPSPKPLSPSESEKEYAFPWMHSIAPVITIGTPTTWKLPIFRFRIMYQPNVPALRLQFNNSPFFNKYSSHQLSIEQLFKNGSFSLFLTFMIEDWGIKQETDLGYTGVYPIASKSVTFTMGAAGVRYSMTR